jgi:hypothetical protein
MTGGSSHPPSGARGRLKTDLNRSGRGGKLRFMKCPLCKSRGKEVDISDAGIRDRHAKKNHEGVTGADLEVLAQPYTYPLHTMADLRRDKK